VRAAVRPKVTKEIHGDHIRGSVDRLKGPKGAKIRTLAVLDQTARFPRSNERGSRVYLEAAGSGLFKRGERLLLRAAASREDLALIFTVRYRGKEAVHDSNEALAGDVKPPLAGKRHVDEDQELPEDLAKHERREFSTKAPTLPKGDIDPEEEEDDQGLEDSQEVKDSPIETKVPEDIRPHAKGGKQAKGLKLHGAKHEQKARANGKPHVGKGKSHHGERLLGEDEERFVNEVGSGDDYRDEDSLGHAEDARAEDEEEEGEVELYGDDDYDDYEEDEEGPEEDRFRKEK